MKKNLIILSILLVLIIGTNYVFEKYLFKSKGNNTKNNIEKNINKNLKPVTKIEVKSKVKVDNKINALRKRFELKGLITKGDIYVENGQNILALQSYLSAIKQNPDDKKIIKKVGDTYFEMKKFLSAYNYYKDLIGTDLIDPKKIAITYFYTLPKDKNKLKFEEIYKNIGKFNLDKDDTFFYKTSIECIFNKDLCEDSFEKYTKNYFGKNQNIIYIKEAFKNYKDFQIKEQYFKDTQILLAIFKAKLYSVTNILSKDILKEKNNYKPVIKIIAKGNFEIGNYKESKKYLLEFNKIDSNDPKVNYMLGIININLHEYLLSNIYFIKALKSGYKNRENISRRLIYNYYLEGDNNKMLLEFKNLINNLKEINAKDYNLAIYYSLINGETLLANKWTNKALEIFPENENFYGYKGWILKENLDLENAEIYLKKGLKINLSNPMINLNLGIIYSEQGNIIKAKILFKNTIKEDPKGIFGKIATKKLEEILIEQEKIKQDIIENT